MPAPGRIVILNGAPRAGKTSIATALQASLPGTWINLGVDTWARATPAHLLPGIGLRPGGERPDLEPLVVQLYGALYDSIAAHVRLGLDVVADFGHHDDYSAPLGILPACARRLAGLDVLFVGVRCPLAVIMARRNADPQGRYAHGDTPPPPVLRWQAAVHVPGIYDLMLDTALLTPEQAAALIGQRLAAPAPGPSAFERLAQM
ncbi:MAG: chloramphenicol phosphotransferase CPT family protein [Cypionkella sp.]